MASEGLAALVERLAPGGRLVRSSRLRGGIGSLAHRLDIDRADGSRLSVSLRRSALVGDHAHVTPEKATYEFAALAAIRTAGIPVPEPLLLDADGDLLGEAALVLGFIPGRTHPGDRSSTALERTANALLAIHSIDPASHDLSAIETRGRDAIRARVKTYRPHAVADPFAGKAHAAIERAIDRIEFLPLSLTHGDFWSGNVIWSRDRIAGIVDWSGAAISDTRRDIADYRVDLVMIHGMDAADAFTRAYEALYGAHLADLWFFDLWRGIDAYVECEHWLEGYHDLGLNHLQPRDVRARLREFFERGLESRG